MLYKTILVVHVILAIGLVGLVLLQQGKGADAGAAFGSGASATVFGARGSGNFLTRTTALLATLFFITSLSLAVMARQASTGSGSVVDTAPPATEAAPAPVPADVPPTPAPAEAPAAPTEGVPTGD